MYIAVIDGNVRFATSIITITSTDLESVKMLTPIREDNTVYCFSQEEEDRYVVILEDKRIAYTITSITPSLVDIAKAEGVNYNSRTEAMEHLSADKDPESGQLPRLLKRVDELERENTLLSGRVREIETELGR